MTSAIYRMAGYKCLKSIKFLERLEKAGWPDEFLEMLKQELPRFESLSIREDFNICLGVFSEHIPESLYPFLRELNSHVRLISAAERSEELHRRAKDAGAKDGLQAQEMLLFMGVGAEPAPTAPTEINFHVKDAKGDILVTKGG